MTAALARRYARWIGALYIITIIAGGWGESYIPDTLLISDNVAETAHRLTSSVGTFRASFAAYLVEAACDVTLNVLLYAMLRRAGRDLALLALCFGLMATAVYAAGEIVYFAAALPATDRDVARMISPEVKATLTYLALSIYGYVNGLFAMFYGMAAAVRGLLMVRSGYLPRTLGVLFILGGAGFIAKNVFVLAIPQWDDAYVLLPMFAAMTAWALWAWVKNVDLISWTASLSSAHGGDLL